MRRTTSMMALAAGLVLAAAGSAEAQQVAGTYTWEMPTRVRTNSDGTRTPEGPSAQVKLVLEVRSDSVFGTYTMSLPETADASPGAAEPREVRGTVSGNRVRWTMTSKGRINMNGSMQETSMTSTYNATIEGDEITVTVDTDAANLPVRIPQRTFKGKRIS